MGTRLNKTKKQKKKAGKSEFRKNESGHERKKSINEVNQAPQIGLFRTQLTSQGVVSPHPRPPGEYNCYVSA